MKRKMRAVAMMKTTLGQRTLDEQHPSFQNSLLLVFRLVS